jgi:23S rRNA pseudouridine1911/1915/1917 synthase
MLDVDGAESDSPPEEEAAETRTFVLPAALDGERLDRVLVAMAPEFSRSYLQQLIGVGALSCNGEAAGRAARRMRVGDKLSLELLPTPQSQAFRPETMTLRVLFEDAHLLVVDKPAGLVVHPAPGNWSGTLLNGLLARDPAVANLPRAGIVHRLDKDTSGLMVVAKTRAAMDELVRRIAAREVSRQYLAIAHRPWTGPAEREVDAPIGRDPRNRLRMAVVDLQRSPGKAARTTIALLAGTDQGCWLRCTLHTGRTHQIRVHVASIGHPLLGDTLYGGHAAAGIDRQALHAFRLAFAHPVTEEPLAFEQAPPADFLNVLANWGLSYNPS